VYPFYSHAAIEMQTRPSFTPGTVRRARVLGMIRPRRLTSGPAPIAAYRGSLCGKPQPPVFQNEKLLRTVQLDRADLCKLHRTVQLSQIETPGDFRKIIF